MMSIQDDAQRAANSVIEELARKGLDYSSKLKQIAEHFEEVVWDGNYDSTLIFGDGTPKLRFIQEKEYEQCMDEDEKPNVDPKIFDEGHYIWVG